MRAFESRRQREQTQANEKLFRQLKERLITLINLRHRKNKAFGVDSLRRYVELDRDPPYQKAIQRVADAAVRLMPEVFQDLHADSTSRALKALEADREIERIEETSHLREKDRRIKR